MRKLIFTLLLVLAAYVAYTYYFGKGDDKARAEAIVRETRDLSRAVGDLLRNKKERYDAGEFDRTIDHVRNTLEKMKANPDSPEGKDEMRRIGVDLRQLDTTGLTPEQRKALEQLIRDIDAQAPAQ